MKRFYPCLTKENHSFFVSPEYIKPYEIDGVLTAPLVFEESILLKPKNTELYLLHDEVLLDKIYLYIPGHGVVTIDVKNETSVMTQLRGDRHHLLMFTMRGKFSLPNIDNVALKLHAFGVVSLMRSIADFECEVLSWEGLQEPPIAIGYDLIMNDKE